MKGYWHIPAFSLIVSILTVVFESYLFIPIYLLWLWYLFYRKRVKIFHFLLSVLLLGIFIIHIPKLENLHPKPQFTSSSFIGKITSSPIKTDKFLRFVVRDNYSKEKIIVYYFFNQAINNNSSLSQVKYGAVCQIKSPVKIPSSSTNPGQFDYQKYLLMQGISYETTISSLQHLDCTGSNPLHVIYSLRDTLLSYTSHLLSKETSSWLTALVLGDDSSLPDELVELFNRWSLSHILAISGLHVGLVVGLIYLSLVKFGITTKEKAQFITILFLPFYALLAGGAPSVWRASLMGLSFLILSKFQIKYPPTDIISIIFISLVAFDPYIIYHVGFQFSFLVTFGLLLSSKWLSQTNSSFWQIMKISFVSQMMIIPLQLHYFYFFQPLSILINTIVVPYFSIFVIPFMFILLILSATLPKIALVFDSIFVPLHTFFIELLVYFDKIFNQPWIIGLPSLGISIFYYILFFLFMKILEGKEKKKSFCIGLSIVGLLLGVSLKPYFSSKGYVTMLDIGQGDAIVIELPKRRGVLFIDAGASFSFDDYEASDKVYKQIIEPYLHSRGITTVDSIMISHEDLDHNGSVPYLIEKFHAKQIIISEFYEINIIEKEIFEKYNIEVKRVEMDEVFTIKDQSFQVLAPEYDRDNPNDNSLVLFTRIGGKNWLFTGDISKSVERGILNSYHYLPVDVLKIAHHGSNTSTDQGFIGHVRPEYALIPVGRQNRYGHPTMEVLETLHEVLTLRTDLYGAIQYEYKASKGGFKTYIDVKRD